MKIVAILSVTQLEISHLLNGTTPKFNTENESLNLLIDFFLTTLVIDHCTNKQIHLIFRIYTKSTFSLIEKQKTQVTYMVETILFFLFEHLEQNYPPYGKVNCTNTTE